MSTTCSSKGTGSRTGKGESCGHLPSGGALLIHLHGFSFIASNNSLLNSAGIPSQTVASLQVLFKKTKTKTSATVLNMVRSNKSQRNSMLVKLLFMQRFWFQAQPFLKAFEYFWFTKYFHLFFFGVRSVYIFITLTKVSHVHYCFLKNR